MRYHLRLQPWGVHSARLCGMLHIVGLLTEGNEGLIPYAIRMLKGKHIDFRVAAMKS